MAAAQIIIELLDHTAFSGNCLTHSRTLMQVPVANYADCRSLQLDALKRALPGIQNGFTQQRQPLLVPLLGARATARLCSAFAHHKRA